MDKSKLLKGAVPIDLNMDVENIYDDMILIPKKEFIDVLRYIYDKKHNFMYIDTQLPEDKQIHKH